MSSPSSNDWPVSAIAGMMDDLGIHRNDELPMDNTHHRKDMPHERPRHRQPIPSTRGQNVRPQWQKLVISGIDDEEGRVAKSLDDLGGARRYAENAGQMPQMDYKLRAPVLMPAIKPRADRTSAVTTPFGGLRRDGVPTRVFVPNAPKQVHSPTQTEDRVRARGPVPMANNVGPGPAVASPPALGPLSERAPNELVSGNSAKTRAKSRDPSAAQSSANTPGRAAPHLRAGSNTANGKVTHAPVHPQQSSPFPAQGSIRHKRAGTCFREECYFMTTDDDQFAARVSLVILQENDGTARPGFLARSIDGYHQHRHHIATCDSSKRIASHCQIVFSTSPTSTRTYVLRFESAETASEFVQTVNALRAVLKMDVQLRNLNHAATSRNDHHPTNSCGPRPRNDISPQEIQDVKTHIMEGTCRFMEIQVTTMKKVLDVWSGTDDFLRHFILELDERERNRQKPSSGGSASRNDAATTMPTRVQYGRTQLQEIRSKASPPPLAVWRYTETLLTTSFLEQAITADEGIATATPNTAEPERPKKGLASSKYADLCQKFEPSGRFTGTFKV
ncbi:hypothetical protein SODALDRAFT_68083 [Sodiomyces alkalinus F11]|uniref:Uncharacterized protein n=1 Tax=Sodiomyces alkalinus (strain CBS 110278 / VKM F-3762 / F11) TaxID=1314773 RepID=A0A3N2PMD5_SODAK|nr:hypothetical protein SODALDRAFT_68083 [Sodiomyces alkalinus F11]ROT35496.1 hypothetical protein SODALDRAFT_68083 [Sodiomyces alkalinus F11]